MEKNWGDTPSATLNTCMHCPFQFDIFVIYISLSSSQCFNDIHCILLLQPSFPQVRCSQQPPQWWPLLRAPPPPHSPPWTPVNPTDTTSTSLFLGIVGPSMSAPLVLLTNSSVLGTLYSSGLRVSVIIMMALLLAWLSAGERERERERERDFHSDV